MCESEGVASVEITKVRPVAAKCSAVAAEQVVLPTPPLPVNMVILVTLLLNYKRTRARNRFCQHYGLVVTNFFLSLLQMSCIVWLPDIAAVGIPPPGLTHCPAI